ncbi:MAG: hypothetical protein LC122_02910 [Chitinophagales bacterium]|nr:hypothetical protein [Chitinophagales bacterium]
MGFIIAFNGLTIFFLPIYIIFLFREVKKDFLLNFIIIFIGIIVTMIPFFPESLSAWANRYTRTNVSKPFWFSFYLFLQEGYYSPLVNNILITVTSLTIILLFLIRKINLIDSLIFAISIVILFSPYNGVARVIPLILLITILSPNISRFNWFSLGLVLYIYLLLDNGYTIPVITVGNTVLFYIPILYVFVIYFYKRTKYNHSILLS